jgi:hypothetical protein
MAESCQSFPLDDFIDRIPGEEIGQTLEGAAFGCANAKSFRFVDSQYLLGRGARLQIGVRSADLDKSFGLAVIRGIDAEGADFSVGDFLSGQFFYKSFYLIVTRFIYH